MQNSEKNTEKCRCSFCNKEFDSDTLFASDSGEIICSNCIVNCYNALVQSGQISPKVNVSAKDIFGDFDDNDDLDVMQNVKKPSEIREYLDRYVIGQDHAKDILSVAVYNHYKMLASADDEDNDVEISKSNILLLGSTGSGKTLLLQTLARFLDVPFTIVDATTLTQAGFVGSDVETGLKMLIQEADGDVELAERGIIYIDEFDKLSRKGENVSLTRDVSGEGVQQSLLKMIEGAIVEVPQGQRKHPQEECIKINTKNILFVCGGSFEGIEKIIQKRIGTSETSIGFGSDPKKKERVKLGDVIDQVNTDDLRKFGLIPEIIGRLPIICTLHDLTKEALVKIMREPKNSLCKQYEKLFEYDNVKLIFENEALLEIANIAFERQVGARGLRGIVESLLLEYMKICPDSNIEKIIITPDYVTGKSKKPDIIYNVSPEEAVG